ncbi:MAG: hypothetical protein ACE37M_01315 [Henriciella sp.]
MQVKSPLADIDFVIGGMRKEGRNLVFKSDPSSSLEATVKMSPGDAWTMIKAFFKSPSAIGFALWLPFSWMTGGGQKSDDAGEAAHPFESVNNPWV